MQELLTKVVYNDQINKTEVKFRGMRIVHKEEEQMLMLNFDQHHTGPAGNVVAPFTMYAVNTIRVPIFRLDENGAQVPVMVPASGVEGEPDYKPAYQATVGEYDLWVGALMQMFAAPLEKAILRKKELLPGDPLVYVLPA